VIQKAEQPEHDDGAGQHAEYEGAFDQAAKADCGGNDDDRRQLAPALPK